MPVLNKKIHKFIFEYSFIFFAFSLPFSVKFNNLFLIVLLLNWVLEGDYKAKLRNVFSHKLLICFVLLYLSYIIGLLYTQNLNEGIKILTKRSSFLILPIVIGSATIERNTILKVAAAFVVAVVFLAYYSLIAIVFDSWNKNDSFQNFNLRFISRDLLWAYSDLHPTYFSIYALFAIALIIFLYSQLRQSKFTFFITIIASLFLLGFTFLLAARMPTIGFILLSFFFLATFLILNRRYYLFLFLIVLIGSGMFLIFSNPLINKRFVEIKQTEWKPPVGIHHNSTNLRIGIFSCSFKAVKEYWLWGIGTGDVQDYLNTCYKSNNYSDVMYLNRYNTHNLYLDTLIMIGIWGLLLLLLFFIYALVFAVKGQNYIYLYFILFFCICGLSEALFNTQKGIVFFSLFNCVLLFKQPKLSNS